jgi:hypothetical protein
VAAEPGALANRLAAIRAICVESSPSMRRQSRPAHNFFSHCEIVRRQAIALAQSRAHDAIRALGGGKIKNSNVTKSGISSTLLRRMKIFAQIFAARIFLCASSHLSRSRVSNVAAGEGAYTQN